jgi:glycosyltransferase involved in cell wall biosynthesis
VTIRRRTEIFPRPERDHESDGRREGETPGRVVLLTHRFTARAFANLARAMARGFRSVGVPRVYLFHLRAVCDGLPCHADPAGPAEGVVDIPLDASRFALAPLTIARFLRAERPDLIITMPSTPSLAALLGWSMAGRRGKLIVSEHAVMTYEWRLQHDRGRKLPMIPHLARALYPTASGIHAVSEGVLTDLLDRVKIHIEPSMTTVIPNPIDGPLVRQLSQSELAHPWLVEPRSIPVVVTAGRLVRVKNQHLLIEAVARVLKKRPIRLIVLGEGPERARLQAAIERLGIQASVELVGFAPNPYRYMARADVFALSSDEEGCPLVLAEALVCGVPVVATETSGAREVLKRGAGVLSPVGDVSAFADALERVLDRPSLRESLRERGFERAGDFAPERVAAEWLAFAARL